jgi:hypothetical protein
MNLTDPLGISRSLLTTVAIIPKTKKRSVGFVRFDISILKSKLVFDLRSKCTAGDSQIKL